MYDLFIIPYTFLNKDLKNVFLTARWHAPQVALFVLWDTKKIHFILLVPSAFRKREHYYYVFMYFINILDTIPRMAVTWCIITTRYMVYGFYMVRIMHIYYFYLELNTEFWLAQNWQVNLWYTIKITLDNHNNLSSRFN